MKEWVISEERCIRLRTSVDNSILSVLQKLRSSKFRLVSRCKVCKGIEDLKEQIDRCISDSKVLMDISDPDKKIECDHKFRDYDWYVDYKVGYVNGKRRFSYTIYEPYVCVKCGKRKDVKLESGETDCFENFDLKATLDTIQKAYPKIRPLAEIEDKIGDDIHVDHEYLKWHDFVTGRTEKPLNCGDDGKIELKL